jgi:hypothetical protein
MGASCPLSRLWSGALRLVGRSHVVQILFFFFHRQQTHCHCIYFIVRADKNWKSLVSSLSGLFCGSLNFIDETVTTNPQHAFVAHNNVNKTLSFRYGALPRETVCTENLTPWIKILPCQHHVLFTFLFFESNTKPFSLFSFLSFLGGIGSAPVPNEDPRFTSPRHGNSPQENMPRTYSLALFVYCNNFFLSFDFQDHACSKQAIELVQTLSIVFENDGGLKKQSDPKLSQSLFVYLFS